MFVLKGLPTRPASVAFSPDGARLVAGLLDGTAQLWDVLGGVRLATVRMPPDEPTLFNRIVFRLVGALLGAAAEPAGRAAENRVVARFAPDGRHLILADWPGVVAVVDATGSPVRVLARRGDRLWTHRGVAVTPDGRVLVTDIQHGIAAFDSSTWLPLPHALRGPGSMVRDALAAEPGGRRVACIGGGMLDLDTGRAAGGWRSPGSAPLLPTGFDWAADRAAIAVTEHGPTVRVFDPDTGTELARLTPSRKHTNAAVFTPDGRCLLTAGTEGVVRVHDANTWAESRVFAWNQGPIYALAVSPDGTRAAAGVGTAKRGKVVVWDLE